MHGFRDFRLYICQKHYIHSWIKQHRFSQSDIYRLHYYVYHILLLQYRIYDDDQDVLPRIVTVYCFLIQKKRHTDDTKRIIKSSQFFLLTSFSLFFLFSDSFKIITYLNLQKKKTDEKKLMV